MIGNLQNIDKNKKEKLINFSEILKKNREKEKKERENIKPTFKNLKNTKPMVYEILNQPKKKRAKG